MPPHGREAALALAESAGMAPIAPRKLCFRGEMQQPRQSRVLLCRLLHHKIFRRKILSIGAAFMFYARKKQLHKSAAAIKLLSFMKE